MIPVWLWVAAGVPLLLMLLVVVEAISDWYVRRELRKLLPKQEEDET